MRKRPLLGTSFWFGKNYNVPDWESSMAGPFDRWPRGLGFDYFYGFVGSAGRFAGYDLFMKDGKLFYHYNLAGVERYTIESDARIPTGRVALKAEYKTDVKQPYAGGTVTLYANNRKIGQGRGEKSIPNRVTLDETLDIGFDTGTPVTESYEMPFAFTGKLNEVAIDLG